MGSPSNQRTGFYFWLFELDRILRGEATRPADIRKADIKIPVVGVAVIVILLAATYGFCMGLFALVRGFENNEYQQALMQTFASICKVPALFCLTLVVTFPSLYVFNALVGSKLRVLPVLKLLIASLAVNLAVLASMGPILAFFSVSTPNYSFIVLLNVVVFAVAGMLGLLFLIQTLNRLVLAEHHQLPLTESRQVEFVDEQVTVVEENLKHAPESHSVAPVPAPGLALPPSSGINEPRRGPLDQLDGIVLGHHVRKVFACWIVVFGLVGAQMGWVLRPFIGSPSQPFSWFRARHSNFFEAVFQTLMDVLF